MNHFEYQRSFPCLTKLRSPILGFWPNEVWRLEILALHEYDAEWA